MQGFILCTAVDYLYKNKKIGAGFQIHKGVLSKRI